MRISLFVAGAVGASMASANASGAVILHSIEQHMLVSLTMTDAGGPTQVDRVADNTTLGPTSASIFARIPMGFEFDYSYAALTMDLSLGGGSIIEADNHLFVEHFIPFLDPAPELTGTATIATVIEFEFTGGVNFTMFATLGGGGPDNAGATTINVQLDQLNDDGVFVQAVYGDDGWEPGVFRASYFSSLTLDHPGDDDWSAGSYRSRHVLQFVPSPSSLLAVCAAALGLVLTRRR